MGLVDTLTKLSVNIEDPSLYLSSKNHLYSNNVEPSAQGEIDYFTTELTGLWKKMDFFQWILQNSHGVHASTGMPEYCVYLNDTEACGTDVQAIKKGNTLTFEHMPGHGWHNIMIVTSQLLCQAISGYLLTGDSTMGEVTKQYCKGITATIKCMQGQNNNQYLMARNLIPESHSYETDGRTTIINYDNWRNSEENWNARRIHFPNNPFWGDIYITNTRSRDDLPHIFRAAAFLPNVIENGEDLEVVEAAREAYEYLKGFCQDIVDHDYHIRTIDENNEAYSPKGDLARFLKHFHYDDNAKLTISLLASGTEGSIKIKKSYGGIYERIATKINYYNHKIFNGFHMTAILHSLNNGKTKTAKKLIKGLERRAKRLMKKKYKNTRWKPDLAVFLLQSATVGMPLTQEQADLIHDEFSKAIKQYSNFQRWDLWDESVPDGIYGVNGGYRPDDEGLVRPEEIALVLEYCYSPYRSQTGAKIVNPEIVADLSRWG